MADYSGRGDFSGTAYKAGGDNFTLDRYAVTTPNYIEWQRVTPGRYNIDNCQVNVNYTGGRYWGDANLASGYSYQLHQGWSYNYIVTGNVRGDGANNLSESGWIWCNAWSTTDTWHGGGDFTVNLSREGTKTIYFNFGTRRSAPFEEGNGAHPSYVITINFERCPKRYVLKDPNITTRTSNRIAGSVQYDADGVTPTRIDSRLQKVQPSYSYGNDVIGGWHGQGDHSWFDYTGLNANTQYELHSHVVNSDYNDTPSNGNQEGTIVRTTRHWTLPIVGSATVTTSMNSATAFNWSRTDGGTWVASSRYYRIRYRQKGTTSWTTTGWSTNTSGIISSLTAGKIYEVQIQPRAHGGGGDNVDGSWSGTSEVQLGVKWTVTGITSSGHTYNSINGLSSISKDGNPGKTNYQFRIKKDGTSTWTTSSSLTINLWDATGLQPNTKYNVQARVYNAVGWSDWSSTVNFYTSPKAGTASASCVRNNTTNSLNIKVNVGGTYTPDKDRYQIRYKFYTDTNWTTLSDSANQTQTVSGLLSDSTYDIQVRARTAKGLDGTYAWSNWSSSIRIRVVKPAKITDAMFVSNTINSVTVEVSYQNNYPNANRIYYALVPVGTSNPGRITNMFVATSQTKTSITINKDYQNNPLQPDTAYICYVIVNQYKSGSDWYTAGLDLNSSSYDFYTATSVNVGTLSNISCIRNNTYDSLTIKADKAGTWTIYAGWQLRYKKLSQSDSDYTLWTAASKDNKVMSGLIAGETYKIQIRGTTGIVNDIKQYYSPVYELTVKVAKRPTLQLSINSITTNKVKITAKITDRGYPEVNSIVWHYASNSFITLTYVPNTFVQASTTNINSTNTSATYEYTLYKQAMYDFKVEARQYKSGADWYTAGIDNRTAFTIRDIELSLYSGRTDRLKVSQNGTLKTIDKIYHTKNGTTWEYDGQRKDSNNSKSSMQWAYINTFENVNYRANWFYGDGNSHKNNELVKQNFETYIPMVDNVRKDICTAYGGNLLPNKLDLDFTKLDSSLSLTTDTNYFDIKKSKNALSLKYKKANTILNTTYVNVINMSGFSKLLNMNLIKNMYIEYNVNIIANNSDDANIGSMYYKYISVEDPTKTRGEIITKPINKSRFLVAIPVNTMLEMNYRFDQFIFCVFKNTGGFAFNAKNAGTIINFSNFGIYYTLL